MFGQHALKSPIRRRAGSLLLAAAALLPCAGAWSEPKPEPPPRSKQGPRPLLLARKSGLKRATGDELRQFHNELERQGWHVAGPAPLPVGYLREGESVRPVGTHFATLYGDVDGDRQPEWVVGYHFPPRKGPAGSASTGSRSSASAQDDRAHIVVFKREENRWKSAWISPGLGYEFQVPKFNMREVGAGLDAAEHLGLPLSLVDIDGDGHLEISYQCWSESETVGALPGVYRYDGSRWTSVAPQADRFSLQDVDGDGKSLEVVTGSRYVGYGMGDDDVPRVWRWNGRQYQEASSDFPDFYARLARRYAEHVRHLEQTGEEFERPVWERAIQKAASLAG